jgi:hypothetical protein
MERDKMEGRIYIASSFTEIGRACGCRTVGCLCNDPHFRSNPPTWGICRTDYRRVVEDGDFVFFVLPKYGRIPQMVFSYLKVLKKITHLDAYHRRDLFNKRMGKNLNGNIIVDERGEYNRFDGGAHRKKFDEIKQYYIVGDRNESKILTEAHIRRKAASFVPALSRIFGQSGCLPYDIISRKGRRMTSGQVKALIQWINE